MNTTEVFETDKFSDIFSADVTFILFLFKIQAANTDGKFPINIEKDFTIQSITFNFNKDKTAELEITYISGNKYLMTQTYSGSELLFMFNSAVTFLDNELMLKDDLNNLLF
jgi:hypothetical protein